MPSIRSTVIIEANVSIGPGTSIWDNVHIRHDSSIGEEWKPRCGRLAVR
jgi:UDP-2-acetamido-3-amino-2,3-dideoxy-glucuronate N-acetyltransferase